MVKKRYNFMLSSKAHQRLEELNNNARKLYGHKDNRSRIIEELILGTKDPKDRLTEEKRELIKKINQIDEEIKAMDEFNQANQAENSN